ncbi:hypothetical protein SAMN06296241_0069 [Salinimicrobium sediminis]|uniref:Sulfotransferase family protein n=1 Tax=Salinimicrobium sediminis TaxID=1343891 RepID=A0A285X2G0_9FLAO|nr:sulfotransferase family protein [Salinimicrobium sediminis]SOC78559.1 hypothetical protein SAMN06296241_0069 [Salinimicrobium sediminis]
MKNRYNKHIIIVGSARSGTSWLAETIAAQHRYRLLFEPEHEFNTELGKLICDKDLNSRNISPLTENYFKKIFLNQVDNDWIAQCSNRKFKRHLWPLIPKKIIVKFVRANLAAHFMNEHFQIPLIHILRNPYDVIHSQQRVRFSWLYDLSHFLKQEELVELVYSKFKVNLNEVDKYSEIEVLAIRWCLENVIPIQVREPYSYKSKIVYHEHLRSDMDNFLELCEYFGLQPINDLSKKYSLPSSKTHPGSEIRGSVINQAKFSPQQYREINGILDKFKCELYQRQTS